ncbi:MAG: helix-turn-helix transcriptional regulator [Bacillus sp. (in: Bacteria)]|nr:helix-turn-helix transcriptional regulator [Bacillus sp. (in: firmicutes)]MCM1426504.1 helix-turn-helix transcriptional regulator [Eubacterium sp.]
MKYCDFVKQIRKQLNYTQKELANALNVSFATVNRWENSQVLPSKLAMKSFLDFCENNFIDISDLEN